MSMVNRLPPDRRARAIYNMEVRNAFRELRRRVRFREETRAAYLRASADESAQADMCHRLIEEPNS